MIICVKIENIGGFIKINKILQWWFVSNLCVYDIRKFFKMNWIIDKLSNFGKRDINVILYLQLLIIYIKLNQ